MATPAAGNPLGHALAPLQTALGTLTENVANAGVTFASFQILAGSVSSLLQALNPGLTQAMNYSLRELQAAFGLLVEPIARELTPLFRELAATLAPAFRALQ